MNVLVTGGAGFIGSHLVESRLAMGDHVEVLDNYLTGTWHLDGAKYTYGSVADHTALPAMVDDADLVFHLAAVVGERMVMRRPVETLTTNVAGTMRVLELCTAKRKRVLFMSTSEVYGKQWALAASETDELVLGSPQYKRWGYAASKLVGEHMALSLFSERSLEVVVVRLFNTSGPRQTGRYGMVIPRFVGQALAGDPITVHGYGDQTRSFAHVKDVVRCLNKLVECPQAMGRIVNVGGSVETSIYSLAFLVKERAESASIVTFLPHHELMPQRRPSLALLNDLIFDIPTTPLKVIVDDVIAHQRGLA